MGTNVLSAVDWSPIPNNLSITVVNEINGLLIFLALVTVLPLIIDIIKIFAGLDGNGSLHYVHGKDKKGREIASDYASWNDSAYNPDNFDDGDDTEYDSWG